VSSTPQFNFTTHQQEVLGTGFETKVTFSIKAFEWMSIILLYVKRHTLSIPLYAFCIPERRPSVHHFKILTPLPLDSHTATSAYSKPYRPQTYASIPYPQAHQGQICQVTIPHPLVLKIQAESY
jgi:hypothetical protein